MDEKKEYYYIFKSTFLFGFVQVFNILIKVGINKAVAVFLGIEGLGIIGLYQSIIGLVKAFAGLGISQSSIRDISEAYTGNDNERFNRMFFVSKRIIFFTSALGLLMTVLFSYWISIITFGNDRYTCSVILVSLAVFFSILSDGQLGILKGLRQLGIIARASLFGSSLGLVSSLILFYIYKNDGIVPSLIISSMSAAAYTWFYVEKIKTIPVNVTLNETFKLGKGMIKMGFALMSISLMGLLTEFIIRAYISHFYGLYQVGIFLAGSTIITGYFGVIVTALFADYYPRICISNKSNFQLELEMNRQAKVSLLLVGPMVIVLLFANSFFIKLLYTASFISVTDYICLAVFSTLINIPSNTMGIILLAKRNGKSFVLLNSTINLLTVVVSVFFYDFFGLKGIGVASIIVAVVNFGVTHLIIRNQYNINFSSDVIKVFIVVLFFCISAFFCSRIQVLSLKYSLYVVISLINIIYTYRKVRNILVK